MLLKTAALRSSIQFAVILAVMFATVQGIAYWNADDYTVQRTQQTRPARDFPILARTGSDELTLVDWGEYETFKKQHPAASFLLPGKAGVHDLTGGDGGSVRFSVVRDEDGSQTIELTAVLERYRAYARYSATDRDVKPEYFRIYAYLSAAPGLVLGVIIAYLVGRLFPSGKKQSSTPPAGKLRQVE